MFCPSMEELEGEKRQSTDGVELDLVPMPLEAPASVRFYARLACLLASLLACLLARLLACAGTRSAAEASRGFGTSAVLRQACLLACFIACLLACLLASLPAQELGNEATKHRRHGKGGNTRPNLASS